MKLRSEKGCFLKTFIDRPSLSDRKFVTIALFNLSISLRGNFRDNHFKISFIRRDKHELIFFNIEDTIEIR